ncbi:unnamed protein product [Schistosoma rodhaini]|uniref:Sjoegren syndrome nuclear autoantigen 1 n=2 Tax=Schistosoma TaxID=6181 RepID=A0AA85FLU1_9TREM|nr:unnamed protein product [Schistosoma rodhaini]
MTIKAHDLLYCSPFTSSCLEVLVIHCYQTRKPVKRKLLLFCPQPFEPFDVLTPGLFDLMSHQGAALQNYNNELVKCFEELCKRREDLQRQIQQDETERAKLQREISVLNDKLSRVNESLDKKLSTRNEYDRTIAESEAAYMKILESSQTLLTVLKREGQNIVQKATAKNVPF